MGGNYPGAGIKSGLALTFGYVAGMQFAKVAQFDSADSLNAAFVSTAGQTTMAHAKTFLSEITAFVIVEKQIA